MVTTRIRWSGGSKGLILLVLIVMMFPSPGAAEPGLVARDGGTARVEGDAVSASRLVPRSSSFIGGPGFDGSVADVVIAPGGDVFIVGSAKAGLKTTAGVVQPLAGGNYDAYLMKLDAQGDLVFSTYLGGEADDQASAVALGDDGSIFVAGGTFGEFPVTEGAFQTVPQHEFDPECWEHCSGDGFVTKISPDGSDLLYSTYLGGEQDDGIDGLTVTTGGTVYVTGSTDSENYPTTARAFQRNFQSGGCDVDFCKRDVTLSALDPTGSSLIASTYFGGWAWDASAEPAIDASGNLVIGGLTTSADLPLTPDAAQSSPGGGFDAYVAVMRPDLEELEYASYLARKRDEMVNGIAIDDAGEIYVTGFTSSPGFPVTGGAYQSTKAKQPDAFVLRLASDTRQIVTGTFLGGSAFDGGFAIDTSDDGTISVAGATTSADFPTIRGALRRNARLTDIFITRLTADLSTLGYSTLYGGSGDDTVVNLTLDGNGGVYLGGATQSRDFPLAGRPLTKRMRLLDGALIHLVPGRSRTVFVRDDGFSARRTSITAGTTIRWHFKTSGGGHAVKDASGTALFGSGRRPSGSSYYFTFDSPGRYKVVDPKSGHRGVVEVTAQQESSCTAAASRIAFVRDLREPTGNEIFTIRPDGRRLKRLTHNTGDDWGPSWSPDGRKIAFSGRRDGNTDIYVMDRPGDNVVRLTDHPGSDSVPAWSPDGTKIAFSSSRDDPEDLMMDLFVMNADGGDVTKISAKPGSEANMSWSPDGTHIAFDHHDRIYSVAVDGTDAKPLTARRRMLATNPSWSHDGRRILFQAQTSEDTGMDIFVMRSDGASKKGLVVGKGEQQSPSWSPNDKHFAFSNRWRLARARSDGTGVRNIARHNLADYSVDWGRAARC